MNDSSKLFCTIVSIIFKAHPCCRWKLCQGDRKQLNDELLKVIDRFNKDNVSGDGPAMIAYPTYINLHYSRYNGYSKPGFCRATTNISYDHDVIFGVAVESLEDGGIAGYQICNQEDAASSFYIHADYSKDSGDMTHVSVTVTDKNGVVDISRK